VVKVCAASIRKSIDALLGFDVRRQRDIDKCLIALDGTENKGRFGGNPCRLSVCKYGDAVARP